MFLERVKALIRRRRLERDLDDELAFHLAMRAERHGETEARRRFGNVTRIRETCHDLWTFTALDALGQDLRYAVRTLAASPGFTAVAVLSLSLGIGANAALFSLMDVMLLRPLPVRHPQELVEFARAHPDGAQMTNLLQPVFERFQRESSGVLSEVLAVSPSTDVFRAGGASGRVRTHEVSGSFFPMLGVPPLLGRPIGAEDDRAGRASRVVVLSHGFWSRRFGRDPSIVGATVRVSDEPFTVVGVMPEGFFGIDRASVPDLWAPLARDQRYRYVWVIGRLRPGVSMEHAQAALAPAYAGAIEDYIGLLGRLSDQERSSLRSERLLVNRATAGTSVIRWSYWSRLSTLKILLVLTGLVLLIACMNLANLLMARSAARAKEIGIRLALGAGRWRVTRQLMTENLMLALGGGVLGMALAGWGHRLLLWFLVRDPLRAALDYRLDLRLVGFGLALSTVTAMLFGMAPALRATRHDLGAAIHSGGRQTRALSLPFAKAVMVAQVALSMVLLVGAGLFTRSLRNLGAADPGMERENLLLVDVRPPAGTPQARRQFWTELAVRLAGLPGVRSAALAGDAVFGRGQWRQTVWIERPGQAPQVVNVADNLVSAGFFATTGIPVLDGREFGEQDRDGAPLVILVNRAFANRYFGGDSPIGRRLGDRGPASAGRYEIVGMVADAKYADVRETARPMVFYPMGQDPPRASCVLHVRTAAPPESLGPAIRREILAVDSSALVSDSRTIPQVIEAQLRPDRMFAALAGFFALLALALGGIGIYGVLAYRVARRTPEIGVRMALGAGKRDVLWLIMRETVLLLAAGSVMGVPAAVAAARLVKTLLYGLEPMDPASIVSSVIVLFAAGCLAGYLPARRAASLEPTAALRSE